MPISIYVTPRRRAQGRCSIAASLAPWPLPKDPTGTFGEGKHGLDLATCAVKGSITGAVVRSFQDLNPVVARSA